MEKNMKHCFIINPASGKQTTKEGLDVKIAELCSKRGADFDIFFTQKSGDARDYIANYMHNDTAEEIRFYACGGDGTVSECVNGFMSREDRSNMSLGVVPVGTGNDLVRGFEGNEAFLDIEAQLDAVPMMIDLLRCNDFYSVNMINVGFDCQVASKTAETKKHFPSKLAYIAALVVTLIKKPGTVADIFADGEAAGVDRDLLLMTFANGNFCGGGFRSNPNAKIDSGEINGMFVKNISRTTFLGLVGSYKAGTHLNEKNASVISERCAKTFEVSFDAPTQISVDGEIVTVDGMKLECVPEAMSFLVPNGAVYLSGKLSQEAAV